MVFLNLFIHIKNIYIKTLLTLKLTISALINTLKNLLNFTGTSSKINTSSNYFMRDFIFTWKVTNSEIEKLPTQTPPTTLYNIKPYLDSISNQANIASSGSNFYSTMFQLNLKNFFSYITTLLNKSFGFSFYYIQGFVFVLFIDACLTDDEPL